MHNIDPFVQTQLYKLAGSGLCSGVAGQMMTSLMVRPPLPGQESYELFATEESAIFESLKRRAVSVSDHRPPPPGRRQIGCIPRWPH